MPLDPTRAHVQMAAKLYEARDAARTLLADKYTARMAEIGTMLKNVAEVRGNGELEAAIAVCKHYRYDGIQQVLVLAAAVELVEPSE